MLITIERTINKQFCYKDFDTNSIFIASQVEVLKAGKNRANIISLTIVLICLME
jgi:hypothetical protein